MWEWYLLPILALLVGLGKVEIEVWVPNWAMDWLTRGEEL